MNRRKKTWIAVILLSLIFLLAALILLRMIRQHTEIVPAAETEIETEITSFMMEEKKKYLQEEKDKQ